jgi:hypothetical protein
MINNYDSVVRDAPVSEINPMRLPQHRCTAVLAR